MSSEFTGTGWSFPLRVDSNGGIAMLTGAEKLEQAMCLVLTTYPGERPMRPGFGSRLRDFVFAGTDQGTLDEISREVLTSLTMWEPRTRVDDIEVTISPDDSCLVQIDIAYTIKTTNDRRNLVFPFYTIPELPPRQEGGR
ncbi:GPW/gp25 family protein [Streptomyces chartreusis]|uniref:GPW/gp25 family protein n=1 Tax=Streptomyces chartreusis TaxID=1969 RepID=UPI0033F5ECEB